MKGATQGLVTISMFVINGNGEILLHQQHDNSLPSGIWSVPCFVHDNQTATAYDTAQNSLQALGLKGEIYEFFGQNHVVIALTTTDPTALSLPSEYAWCSLHRVVQDTRERPFHYSLWLKTSLEGVILYLKTHLKNDILAQGFSHFEL